MADVIHLRQGQGAAPEPEAVSHVRTIGEIGPFRVELEQWHGSRPQHTLIVTASRPGQPRIVKPVPNIPQAEDTVFADMIGRSILHALLIARDAYDPRADGLNAGRDELTDEALWLSLEDSVVQVMRGADAAGYCPLAAAELAFPGMPAVVLARCFGHVQQQRTAEWRGGIKRAVSDEIIRRAAITAGSR